MSEQQQQQSNQPQAGSSTSEGLNKPAPTINQVIAPTVGNEVQGISQANSINAPTAVEQGVPTSVIIEGRAAQPVGYQERQDPSAQIQAQTLAAPKQQIAPVSTDGVTTSARTTPQSQIAEAPQSEDHNKGEDGQSTPDTENPPVSDSDSVESSLPPPASQMEGKPSEDPIDAEESQFGSPLTHVVNKDEGTPLQQIKHGENFANSIPGRFRVY